MRTLVQSKEMNDAFGQHDVTLLLHLEGNLQKDQWAKNLSDTKGDLSNSDSHVYKLQRLRAKSYSTQ